MTDKELMFTVKEGELDNLGTLFERHNLKLYNYFLKATLKPDLSQDLVQEVFLRLLKFRNTYKGDGLFSTWLYRIAHNVLYDSFRKKKNNRDLDDVMDTLSDGTNIYNDYESGEQITLLEQAFTKLKESDRELLTLKRYQNLKYEEIAKIKNCAVGTVKSKIHHALNNLRTIFFELSNEARL